MSCRSKKCANCNGMRSLCAAGWPALRANRKSTSRARLTGVSSSRDRTTADAKGCCGRSLRKYSVHTPVRCGGWPVTRQGRIVEL